jgi:homoserine kinase
MNNHIPIASGLGSSAAARLGGILLAYKVIGRKINVDEVLKIGVKLEGHPDNIVPALLGGLCVSTMVNNEVKYVKLPAPKLKAVIVNPYFELETKKARKALPKKIKFSDAVFNVSRAVVMLAAIEQGKFEMLRFCMEDKLHQPYREKFIFGMRKVFEKAYRSGAYGAAISGAGPSLIALSSINKADKIGKIMKDNWKKLGINSRFYILDFDNSGAK